MRNLVMVITLLISANLLLSQTENIFPTAKNGSIEIYDTIVTNKAAKESYVLSQKWISSSVDDYKKAIMVENQNANLLIAKLRFPATSTHENSKNVSTDISYKIDINNYDGKTIFHIYEVTIFGRIFDMTFPRFYSGSPDIHIQHISDYQREIDNIRDGKSIEKLSTKKQNKINDINTEINREKTLYNAEFNVFSTSISKLKAILGSKQ